MELAYHPLAENPHRLRRPFQDQMFLIAVDSHSKWPEVVAIKKTTAEATISELRRLFSCYGLPEKVVSDNGPHFVSRILSIFEGE